MCREHKNCLEEESLTPVVVVSPPYNISPNDVEIIATTVQRLVIDYFASQEAKKR